MILETRKQDLLKQIQQKSAQYNQVENVRTQLSNEILMLKGKLDILEELIEENKDSKPVEPVE